MRRTFKITRRQLLQASAATLAAPMLGTGALAQAAWPNRPVRVVVPYPPAGGADTTARLFFTKLGEMWGAQFVIDNRGGAGGTIAAAAVAKADPDGYTIMHDATAHSVNPALYSNLSFNYSKDFAPVFLVSLVPNILVANTRRAGQDIRRRHRGGEERRRAGSTSRRRATARCSTSASRCSSTWPRCRSITCRIVAADRR